MRHGKTSALRHWLPHINFNKRLLIITRFRKTHDPIYPRGVYKQNSLIGLYYTPTLCHNKIMRGRVFESLQ
jgi:hypothetical protein